MWRTVLKVQRMQPQQNAAITDLRYRRQCRRARQELARLSDLELRDIGIPPDVVYEAVVRHFHPLSPHRDEPGAARSDGNQGALAKPGRSA